jgi:hypothetical protein
MNEKLQQQGLTHAHVRSAKHAGPGINREAVSNMHASACSNGNSDKKKKTQENKNH